MRLLRILLVTFMIAASISAQSPASDFRNTDDYKSARALYTKLGGQDFTEFDRRYEEYLLSFRVMSPTDMARYRLTKTPPALYELFARSFKEFAGLDPNLPVSEQFFQRTTVYVPIKGYEKLNTDQALVDHYHYWIFTRRIENAIANIRAAHDRAKLAIDQCDESLMRQAIWELDFAASEYERIDARADEQIDQNDHQLRYYDQEMIWIEEPGLEVRGDKTSNIVEYLKLDVSMRELRQKGTAFKQLQKDIDARRAFISKWSDRIVKVKSYVAASIPKIRENQAKIRQAFENKCLKCQK